MQYQLWATAVEQTLVDTANPSLDRIRVEEVREVKSKEKAWEPWTAKNVLPALKTKSREVARTEYQSPEGEDCNGWEDWQPPAGRCRGGKSPSSEYTRHAEEGHREPAVMDGAICYAILGGNTTFWTGI